MSINTLDKIKESLSSGVNSVYSYNNIPVRLTDIQFKQTGDKLQLLMIGVSKNNKMALVFNALLPQDFIPDNVWSIPMAFNEFLKLILSKLTEYSINEMINEAPLKWGLILTIEFDSVVTPVRKYKEVKILASNNYHIKFWESFNSDGEIEFSLIKRTPNFLLPREKLENTIITLNLLSELSMIDINHRLRSGIYALRILPVKLVMITNSPKVKFMSINITVGKKNMRVGVIDNNVENGFDLPLRIIERGGWVQRLIESMTPLLVKQ